MKNINHWMNNQNSKKKEVEWVAVSTSDDMSLHQTN